MKDLLCGGNIGISRLVAYAPELSDLEFRLYAIISDRVVLKNKGFCDDTNGVLGRFVGKSEGWMRATIKKLEDIGLVTCVYPMGGMRQIFLKSGSVALQDNFNWGVSLQGGGVSLEGHHNIYSNNNILSKDNNIILQYIEGVFEKGQDKDFIKKLTALTKQYTNSKEKKKVREAVMFRLAKRQDLDLLHTPLENLIEILFDEWYAKWKRKDDKQTAKKEFIKLINAGVDYNELVKGRDRYNAKLQSEKTERMYWKKAYKWLQGKNWEDGNLTNTDNPDNIKKVKAISMEDMEEHMGAH